METLKAERVKWIEAVKADKDIGGEKLAETQRASNLVIERFMPPELRTILRETGYGDHPQFVRFLANIGAAMKEDSGLQGGGAGTGGKKSAEQVLYGGTTT